MPSFLKTLTLDLAVPLSGLILLALYPSQQAFLAQIAITAILVLSLDLVVGFAGLATLGHVAMFGAGAYAAGLYALHIWAEPLSGLLIGAAAGAVVAGLTAVMLMRTHGLTFLMMTVAITQILYEVVSKARAVTGGDDGLYGIVMRPVLGVWEFDFLGRLAFWYSLVVLWIVFMVLRRLMQTPFGQTVLAIRDDAGRVTSLGGNVYRHRVVLYTISGSIAGLAGALSAQTVQVVGLSSLSVTYSAEVLVMLVLGGTGRLWGALVGTVMFMLIHHYTASIDPIRWMLFVGIILVAVVLFLPGGLTRGFDMIVSRLKGRVTT
tara:strand:- start:29964 stop:30923 length:960 start_codon:yes stop_codon:yes gene_type:complete